MLYTYLLGGCSCHQYFCTLGFNHSTGCALLTNNHSVTTAQKRAYNTARCPSFSEYLPLNTVLHRWKLKDPALVRSLPLRLPHGNTLWLVAAQCRSSSLRAEESRQYPLIAALRVCRRSFPLGNGPSGPPYISASAMEQCSPLAEN